MIPLNGTILACIIILPNDQRSLDPTADLLETTWSLLFNCRCLVEGPNGAGEGERSWRIKWEEDCKAWRASRRKGEMIWVTAVYILRPECFLFVLPLLQGNYSNPEKYIHKGAPSVWPALQGEVGLCAHCSNWTREGSLEGGADASCLHAENGIIHYCMEGLWHWLKS